MITVGIPTYNEENVISGAVLSALKNISKKDEVIVVASGCTDNTEKIVRDISKKHKQVRLIIESRRKGKASALNIIMKEAKGNIIVQTDGDVVLEKNSIKYLLGHFKNKKVGAVSGRPVPIINKNNLFYDWSVMSYQKMHERRLEEIKQGDFWHLSGYLFAHTKKALSKMPTNVKGSTDGTMGYLIRQGNYKINYEPLARVRVKCPTNARDFINQKARARTGFYQLKERFNIPPREIKSELIYFPREMLKLKSPIKMLRFIAVGFIYFYSWLKALWFIKMDKSILHVWRQVESTKV